MAVLILICLDITFTIKMVFAIYRDVPEPREYDSRGEVVVYTRATYMKDLGEVYSPYKFLFKDYCHKYRYYKIGMMWLKIILLYVSFICIKYDQ